MQGLPKSSIEHLDKVENRTGYRYIGLDDNFGYAMGKITNENTRRKLYNAKENLHKKLNLPIFEEIIKLRNETALLLGFTSYTD